MRSASMSEDLTCLENLIASLGDVQKPGTGKVEGIGWDLTQMQNRAGRSW
jgi:hypothetical protein